MKSRKVLIGIGLTLTAVVIVHYVRTRKKREKKRTHIANEGYETAEDILYPKRSSMKLG
jgi:predicted small secreted protein